MSPTQNQSTPTKTEQLAKQIGNALKIIASNFEQRRESTKKLLQSAPYASKQMAALLQELDQVSCWYVIRAQDGSIIVQAGRVRPYPITAPTKELIDMPIIMGGHQPIAGEPIMTLQVESDDSGSKITCEIHPCSATGITCPTTIICGRNNVRDYEYFNYYPDTDQSGDTETNYQHAQQLIANIVSQLPSIQYQEVLGAIADPENIKIFTKISQLILEQGMQPPLSREYLQGVAQTFQLLTDCIFYKLPTTIVATKINNKLRLRIPAPILLHENLPLLQTMLTTILAVQPTDDLVLEFDDFNIAYCCQDQVISPDDLTVCGQVARQLNITTIPQVQQEVCRLIQNNLLAALLVKLPNLEDGHNFFSTLMNPGPAAWARFHAFGPEKVNDALIHMLYFKYLKMLQNTAVAQEQLQDNYAQLAMSIANDLHALRGPSRLRELHAETLAKVLYSSNDTDLAIIILNLITDPELFSQALELLNGKNYITSVVTIAAIEQHPCYQQLQGWDLVYAMVTMITHYCDCYDCSKQQNLGELNLTEILVLIMSLAKYGVPTLALPAAIITQLTAVATDLDTVFAQLQAIMTPKQIGRLPSPGAHHADYSYRVDSEVFKLLGQKIFPGMINNISDLSHLLELTSAWEIQVEYSQPGSMALTLLDDVLQMLGPKIFPRIINNISELIQLLNLAKTWEAKVVYGRTNRIAATILTTIDIDLVLLAMTDFREFIQFACSLPPAQNNDNYYLHLMEIFTKHNHHITTLLITQIMAIHTPTDFKQLLVDCAKAQQVLKYDNYTQDFIAQLLLEHIALIKTLVVDVNYLVILYDYCFKCDNFTVAHAAMNPQKIIAICHDVTGLVAVMLPLIHDNEAQTARTMEQVIAVIDPAVFTALITDLHDLDELLTQIGADQQITTEDQITLINYLGGDDFIKQLLVKQLTTTMKHPDALIALFDCCEHLMSILPNKQLITQLVQTNFALIKPWVSNLNCLVRLFSYCLHHHDYSIIRLITNQQLITALADTAGLATTLALSLADQTNAKSAKERLTTVLNLFDPVIFSALVNNLADVKQLCQVMQQHAATQGQELLILAKLERRWVLQLAANRTEFSQLFTLATNYADLAKYLGDSEQGRQTTIAVMQQHLSLIATFADAKQWLKNVRAARLANPAIVPIIPKQDAKFLVQTITNISQLRELLALVTTTNERLTLISYLGGLPSIKALMLTLATKTKPEQSSVQEFGSIIGMLPATTAMSSVLSEDAAKILIATPDQLQVFVAAAQPRQHQLQDYLEQFDWICAMMHTQPIISKAIARSPQRPIATTKLVEQVATELPQLGRLGASKK